MYIVETLVAISIPQLYWHIYSEKSNDIITVRLLKYDGFIKRGKNITWKTVRYIYIGDIETLSTASWNAINKNLLLRFALCTAWFFQAYLYKTRAVMAPKRAYNCGFLTPKHTPYIYILYICKDDYRHVFLCRYI